MNRLTLLLVAFAALSGCGPKQPVTAWGYSSWISETGAASKESFEEARQRCLATSGVRDPAAVVPGSETEREFVDCMDTSRWCTVAKGCE